MTEAQLQRFEAAVDRLTRAMETARPEDRVERAVQNDVNDEWKRDIKDIRDRLDDVVSLLAEDDE